MYYIYAAPSFDLCTFNGDPLDDTRNGAFSCRPDASYQRLFAAGDRLVNPNNPAMETRPRYATWSTTLYARREPGDEEEDAVEVEADAQAVPLEIGWRTVRWDKSEML
jgi:hypothetical protein